MAADTTLTATNFCMIAIFSTCLNHDYFVTISATIYAVIHLWPLCSFYSKGLAIIKIETHTASTWFIY